MNPPSIPQVSAGGVVVQLGQGNAYEVCLIRRQRHQGYAWCLPKGHLESNEQPSEAALREVQEETGLVAQILRPLGEISYSFTTPADGLSYQKTVTFFLMRPVGGQLGPCDAEAIEARWVPFQQALALATYENERQVLLKAQEVLTA